MKLGSSIILIFCYLSLPAQLIHDESYLDNGFKKFTHLLEQSIVDRDTASLKNLLADRIHESNDICGPQGCSKDDFMKYYFREGAEDSWNEMESILRFGFRRIRDEYPKRIVPHEEMVFQGPSYLQTVDLENELIVLAEKVNVRDQPSTKAKIVKKVSFETLKCDCNILTNKKSTFQTVDGIDWVEVYLNNDSVAYIAAKYSSYIYSREMTIAKVKGRWKVISFYQRPGC